MARGQAYCPGAGGLGPGLGAWPVLLGQAMVETLALPKRPKLLDRKQRCKWLQDRPDSDLPPSPNYWLLLPASTVLRLPGCLSWTPLTRQHHQWRSPATDGPSQSLRNIRGSGSLPPKQEINRSRLIAKSSLDPLMEYRNQISGKYQRLCQVLVAKVLIQCPRKETGRGCLDGG
ncbi:unnamed protein product [Caretta caretta]